MPDKMYPHSELQGMTRLLTDATIGVTEVVEAMHKQIVHPPFFPSSPIQRMVSNLAGLAYKSVKEGARVIGGGVEKTIGQLGTVSGSTALNKEREAMRSALNGIIGDHLEAKENPLEIKMQFRYQGKALPLDPEGIAETYPEVNGNVLVMVHGSCMNDLQWTRKGHNHGTALAESLGKTPVYLHFNSGRHISSNGHELNSPEVFEKIKLWLA